MDEITKQLLTLYGPLAIGWIIAGFLAWRVLTDANRPENVLKTYKDIIHDYHEAILENTRVTERLAMLIEERTRQRHNGR